MERGRLGQVLVAVGPVQRAGRRVEEPADAGRLGCPPQRRGGPPVDVERALGVEVAEGVVGDGGQVDDGLDAVQVVGRDGADVGLRISRSGPGPSVPNVQPSNSRLSRPMTSCPAARKRGTSTWPMYPSWPVTKTFIGGLPCALLPSSTAARVAHSWGRDGARASIGVDASGYRPASPPPLGPKTRRAGILTLRDLDGGGRAVRAGRRRGGRVQWPVRSRAAGGHLDAHLGPGQVGLGPLVARAPPAGAPGPGPGPPRPGGRRCRRPARPSRTGWPRGRRTPRRSRGARR